MSPTATQTVQSLQEYEKVTIKLPKKVFIRLMKNFNAHSSNHKAATGEPLFKGAWFGKEFVKGIEAKQKLRFFESGGNAEYYEPSSGITVEKDVIESEIDKIETETKQENNSNLPYVLFFLALFILIAFFLYLKFRDKLN